MIAFVNLQSKILIIERKLLPQKKFIFSLRHKVFDNLQYLKPNSQCKHLYINLTA